MGSPGTARWGDWLRRYFGGKAGETVNVLHDIMPTVNLLEEAPELRYYRNERRWVAYLQAAAGGAATYARAMLGVPANGNRLTVIERVACAKAAAGWAIAARQDNPLLSTQLTAANALDARVLTNPAVASTPLDLWWSTDAPAAYMAAGVRLDQFTVAAAGVMSWSAFFPGIVLDPGGSGICFQDNTANEAMDVFLVGYDVPLHGDEET